MSAVSAPPDVVSSDSLITLALQLAGHPAPAFTFEVHLHTLLDPAVRGLISQGAGRIHPSHDIFLTFQGRRIPNTSTPSTLSLQPGDTLVCEQQPHEAIELLRTGLSELTASLQPQLWKQLAKQAVPLKSACAACERMNNAFRMSGTAAVAQRRDTLAVLLQEGTLLNMLPDTLFVLLASSDAKGLAATAEQRDTMADVPLSGRPVKALLAAKRISHVFVDLFYTFVQRPARAGALGTYPQVERALNGLLDAGFCAAVCGALTYVHARRSGLPSTTPQREVAEYDKAAMAVCGDMGHAGGLLLLAALCPELVDSSVTRQIFETPLISELCRAVVTVLGGQALVGDVLHVWLPVACRLVPAVESVLHGIRTPGPHVRGASMELMTCLGNDPWVLRMMLAVLKAYGTPAGRREIEACCDRQAQNKAMFANCTYCLTGILLDYRTPDAPPVGVSGAELAGAVAGAVAATWVERSHLVKTAAELMRHLPLKELAVAVPALLPLVMTLLDRDPRAFSRAAAAYCERISAGDMMSYEAVLNSVETPAESDLFLAIVSSYSVAKLLDAVMKAVSNSASEPGLLPDGGGPLQVMRQACNRILEQGFLDRCEAWLRLPIHDYSSMRSIAGLQALRATLVMARLLLRREPACVAALTVAVSLAATNRKLCRLMEPGVVPEDSGRGLGPDERGEVLKCLAYAVVQAWPGSMVQCGAAGRGGGGSAERRRGGGRGGGEEGQGDGAEGQDDADDADGDAVYVALRCVVLQLLPALVGLIREGHADMTARDPDMCCRWQATRLDIFVDLFVRLHRAGLADVTAASGVPALLTDIMQAHLRVPHPADLGGCIDSDGGAGSAGGGDDDDDKLPCRPSVAGIHEWASMTGELLSSAPDELGWVCNEPLVALFRHAVCVAGQVPDYLQSASDLWAQCLELHELHLDRSTTLAPAATWDSCVLTTLAMSHRRGGLKPFLGCCHRGCINLDSDTEAGLQLFKCRKCGLARYCSKACQEDAWRDGHKAACRAWTKKLGTEDNTAHEDVQQGGAAQGV